MNPPGARPGAALPGPPRLPAAADPANFRAPPAHAPVGVTRFVNAIHLTRSQHTRHGQELQALRYRGQTELGVMTCYPPDRQAVADMLRRALKCPYPRVINLMNPGDGGYDNSYVDRMSEGRTVRVGDLYVRKFTLGQAALGPNGQGQPITLKKTMLLVHDPKDARAGWRAVEHHAVSNWTDRTAPPAASFEDLWKAFYVPGLTHQAIIHCYGGVGRTAVLLFRLAFQAYLDHENLQGRRVSPQQTADFLNEVVEEARRMRGRFVLPDDEQARLLYESCLLGLKNQGARRP